MAAKKKTKKSDAFSIQKLTDNIQKTADNLRKEVKTRLKDSSAKAKTQSFDLAISMAKLQQSALDQAFKQLANLQKRSDKLIKNYVQKADWMPSEGKNIVEEWSRMLNSGRDDFQQTMDKSYDLLKNGLERVKKDQKTATKKTTTAKKASKKKPTAAKKKAATKKKPAAKKTAAKKTAVKKASAKKTPTTTKRKPAAKKKATATRKKSAAKK